MLIILTINNMVDTLWPQVEQLGNNRVQILKILLVTSTGNKLKTRIMSTLITLPMDAEKIIEIIA